ncbi:DinB family protein [Rhodohalobacter halophilus]|uniref:DinB family protein n=1 Tax=Rhodohalobacter halophilus TaxID=1812810 RepID=UPI00083F82F1|nr:DinB family protein [Rhodohalobacter halophilus]
MNKLYSYQDIISEYANALQRIDELAEAPEDLFMLKPDAETWSANEIFRHVRRFNNLYLRKIDHIIRNQNTAKIAQQEFKPKWIPKLMIRIMEPPYKLKIPTLAPMYPKISAEKGKSATTSELKETNQMVITNLNNLQSDRADLDKLKGAHPVFKVITMSLTDLFLVMAAHQRRHFWQAEQTLYRLSGTRF